MKRLIAGLLFIAVAGSAMAQKLNSNKFPSPESATYDNNGNDLRGFINKHKNDFEAKGNMVNSASGNDWGYLQVRNVKTPGEDKKGNLNYRESFDVTLLMYKTRNDAKATWWSREYNLPKGNMQYYKVGEPGTLPYENVKYSDVINDLQTKSFTVVEYIDTLVNQNDFDLLLKNSIFLRNGAMKDVNDYRTMVNFYNKFLTRFSNVNDPVLDDKSFITFFKGNNADYLGYFNVLNGKLSGHVELIDAPFERDKVKFVNDVFKNLTGSVVYEYGDENLGMSKMIKMRADKLNLKVEVVKTSSSRKFNEDL